MTDVKHLYKSLKPKSYKIELGLDPDKLSFGGRVLISGILTSDSNEVTLHTADLKIRSAKINNFDVTTKTSKKEDELTLRSDLKFKSGKIDIEITYSGKINENMHGIYPSNFAHEGKNKILIGTQFESHHAREAFPCVDEPNAKATFDLSLTTPLENEVVANTPVKSEESSNNKKTTVFDTTPVMSTYLLAFVFGDMSYIEAETKNNVQVRAYATPENTEHTQFALDVAVKCLDFFDEYFEIPYPLDKCDLLALPDFAAGAMENWGCLTFRESALLVDEKNTSLGSKQWVALVVAHELAHQWFGNLVTMEWWTDLWLNEGFASWVEYLAVDELFPDWKMWEQFVTDDFMRGQGLDSLANSHPVEMSIGDPNEIRSIFDAISYNKGASIIRMLHAYMGPEDFRKGLAHYLDKHKYANAKTSDLWNALEDKSDKKIANFMTAWTSQTGFPVVKATFSDSKFELSQSRYLISPIELKKVKKSDTWPIPLDTNYSSESTLFDNEHGNWNIKTKQPTKLNSDQTGFYMVSYDSDSIKHFAGSVAKGKMNTLDRLGLLNDSFQLAKAAQGKTTDALKLLDSFDGESEGVVWDIMAGQLAALRATMETEELRELMKPYVAELVEPQLKRLGWDKNDSESHIDTLLRPTILSQASFTENRAVVKEALSRFSSMEKPEDQDPDIRGIVYATAVRELNDKATFDKLVKFYKNSSSAQEKVTLSSAITGFKHTDLIEKALSMIKSKDVRLQEVAYWIAYSFMNRHAKEQTWVWLKENWQWLEDKFGKDIMTIQSFPKYAGKVFSSKEFAAEFREFFDSVDTAGIERPIEQSLETILLLVDWKERD